MENICWIQVKIHISDQTSLRICNSVVDSRSPAAAVRPPDQQLSSFIEAGICGTGSYILLSGDWRSGGNDSVCVRYQRPKSQTSWIFTDAKTGIGG
jgi:hypothetical protein